MSGHMKTFILTLAIILFPLNVFAQNVDVFEKNSGLPLKIDSESLMVNQNKSQAIFQTNVVAVQGEMVLKSDQMTVFYNNGDARDKSGKSFSKIEAEGNVRLTGDGKEAFSEKAIYDAYTEEVILTGDVKMKENNKLITGEKFVYDTKSGSSQIIGSSVEVVGADGQPTTKPGRAKAILTPVADDESSIQVVEPQPTQVAVAKPVQPPVVYEEARAEVVTEVEPMSDTIVFADPSETTQAELVEEDVYQVRDIAVPIPTLKPTYLAVPKSMRQEF